MIYVLLLVPVALLVASVIYAIRMVQNGKSPRKAATMQILSFLPFASFPLRCRLPHRLPKRTIPLPLPKPRRLPRIIPRVSACWLPRL